MSGRVWRGRIWSGIVESSLYTFSYIEFYIKIRWTRTNGENIYSNNEKIYFRGIREKSDFDAGIAYNIIIGTTNKFKDLIGAKCTTSVRYLKDAIFGINKCLLSEDSKKLLNDIN